MEVTSNITIHLVLDCSNLYVLGFPEILLRKSSHGWMEGANSPCIQTICLIYSTLYKWFPLLTLLCSSWCSCISGFPGTLGLLMFCPSFLIIGHVDFCLHHLADFSGPGHSAGTEQSAGCSIWLQRWESQWGLKPLKANRFDMRSPGFHVFLFLQCYWRLQSDNTEIQAKGELLAQEEKVSLLSFVQNVWYWGTQRGNEFNMSSGFGWLSQQRK